MYRFILHKKKKLHKEYLNKFSHSSWNSKANTYERIVQKYPCLSFLRGISYKDLLIAPYTQIVSIYYDYTVVESQLAAGDVKELHACFPYDNHRSKILSIIESYYGIEKATTCPYCDYQEISIFKKKGVRRNYHLDHYLDKGKCPLVALSIHNFIPVCPDCNTEKGETTFGTTKRETSLLSPFNPFYDFVGKTHFCIMPPQSEDLLKIRTHEELSKYIITLEYDNLIYQQEESVTKIMSRIYGDNASLAHEEMMTFFRQLLREKSSKGKLDAKLLMEQFAEDAYLTSNEEYGKGLRKRYDKFKRDIIKQLTI